MSKKWKPIASAPKDPTVYIDLWIVGPRSSEGYRQADCHWSLHDNRFVTEYGHMGDIPAGLMIGDEPTHWMPIPSGPDQ